MSFSITAIKDQSNCSHSLFLCYCYVVKLVFIKYNNNSKTKEVEDSGFEPGKGQYFV